MVPISILLEPMGCKLHEQRNTCISKCCIAFNSVLSMNIDTNIMEWSKLLCRNIRMASNSPECHCLQIMVLIAVPGLNQNALRIGESSSSEYYGFILSSDGPTHSIMSKWVCVDASYTENIPICVKTLKSDGYLAPARRGLLSVIKGSIHENFARRGLISSETG